MQQSGFLISSDSVNFKVFGSEKVGIDFGLHHEN